MCFQPAIFYKKGNATNVQALVLCPSSIYFSMAFLFNGCSFARFSCHNAVEPATASHQREKAASYYCNSRVKYLLLIYSTSFAF